MNNILLTPVQLGPIIGMEPHYVDDYELSICRAQVRKVADEMAKFFDMAQLTSPDSLEPPPSIEYLAGEFYKALRKAALEEL